MPRRAAPVGPRRDRGYTRAKRGCSTAIAWNASETNPTSGPFATAGFGVPSAHVTVERRFAIRERGSTVRIELLGGLATFLTMATSSSSTRRSCRRPGCRSTAVAVATALAAAIVHAGRWALATNLPFALAPGLGINAVVAFDIVLGRGLPWPVGDGVRRDRGPDRARARARRPARGDHARGPARDEARRSASASACSSRSSGCARAGIVVNNPATGIGLGDLTSGPALIALAGIAASAIVLIARGVQGRDPPRRARGDACSA